MKMIRAIAILGFVFGVVNCFAQSAISGRVLNQADGKPVANASVFISNATIGDKTAADGTFTLHGVKSGKYDLVVSIIGFELYTQQITATGSNIKLPDIMLLSKTMLLSEVKIKPVHDYNRGMYLNWFTDEFLGTSEIAKDCKIINPEMLDFDYDNVKDVLKASSVDFLVIENNTLGYRVKYLLTNFVLNRNRLEKHFSYNGFVLFEQMDGSDVQKKRWLKARQAVYENSTMHFLRALVNGNLADEGFQMQQLSVYYNPERPPDTLIQSKIKYYTNLKAKAANEKDSLAFWVKKSKIKANLLKLNTYPLEGCEIVQKTNQDGLYALGCENDALYITYNKYGHFDTKGRIDNVDDKYNIENSIIKFNNSYALFDANGWINNPESVLISGVWAKDRVAELLPEDFYEAATAKGNGASLSAMATRLKDYAGNHATEKAYLHLDKIRYMPGDTIWFKAYTVAGENHELSTISDVLHVRLFNNQDSVVSSLNVPLSTGTGWGDIALPVTSKTGDYHLQAYTNWMRNFDAGYFFDRQINVGDEAATLKPKKQVLAGNTDVQFFPEGGALINGLRLKVAVKAINPKGVGEDVSGVVLDNLGTEVAEFSTQHLGMGIFAITPVAGKTYQAKIIAKDGKHYTVDLPKAQDNGFAITINNSEADSLSVRIVASDKLFQTKKNTGYYLLAQSGAKVNYTATFKLSAQSYNTIIDKGRFPTGITRFTLFADNGEPLNERIVFIRHTDTLKLGISTPAKTYAARQKVELKLTSKNQDNCNVSGSFSASVINESFEPVNDASENTILNNLLLTSDLKGSIEHPNYYFTNVTDKTLADLDILMLTQGYHRFEWKQVLAADKPPIVFEPEKGLQVSGFVKSFAGKPLAGNKVSLLTTKGGFFKMDTVTNKDGRFTFSPILDENVKYVIQARTANNKKNVVVSLDTLSKGQYALRNIIPVTTDSVKALTTYQQQVKQQLKLSIDKRMIQLKEVVIKDKRSGPPDLLTHAENPDQVISDFPKEGTGESLSSFLGMRLRGIMVKHPLNAGPNEVHFYSTRELARNAVAPVPMMVKLDGMEIDPVIFGSLQLTDIESAEVIRTSGKMDMTTGATEVLYLISNKHPGGKAQQATDVITYQSNGLYKAREFYSPRYDKVNESSSKPDLRTTIFWKPDIITDKDGNATLSFYNADTRGTYRVIVEGIDVDGNIGRQVYTYVVE
jgi:hypothetical protein